MMNKLFSNNVLNIFTDASVLHKENGSTISCPGAIAVHTTYQNGTCSTTIIDREYSVLDNCTNNRGELYGVYLGVLLALKYRDKYDHINLLCDSQFSIYGLTKWIYDWYKNEHNGVYYNKSGKEVSNQDLFKKIIHNVIMNNLKINFYHQKGHCKNNIEISKKTFKRSNGIDLNDFEAQEIALYNDAIDVFTGTKLNEHANEYKIRLMYAPNFDIQKYYLLIK